MKALPILEALAVTSVRFLHARDSNPKPPEPRSPLTLAEAVSLALTHSPALGKEIGLTLTIETATKLHVPASR
jgi:hypothetical protein